MLTLRPNFLFAAALLSTTVVLPAASLFPTSPLIQLGQDTDIYFNADASINITDNVFTSTKKTSATSYVLAPGFSLEYAKDSPLYATATVKRSQFYYGSLGKLNNTQDFFDGALFIDQGGPLKFVIRSNYRESARNDNLTQLGIDGKAIGETLVRQGDYQHSLNINYRLTEKINLGFILENRYNRYLNPVTIADPNPANINKFVYNTNSLSEINTKSFDLSATYNPPGDLITYGLNFGHAQNDFTPAPYLSTNGDVRPEGIYKSTQDNFNLTARGSLTRSGKLGLSGSFGTSSSTTRNRDTVVGDTKINGLSYSITLRHSLTELVNHEVTLGRSVTPTPSGANSQRTTYGYNATYVATDSVVLNLHVNRSDVDVGTIKIASMDYGLGASYKMNPYLNFTANLSLGETKFPNDSTQNLQTKGFTLSGTFRY